MLVTAEHAHHEPGFMSGHLEPLSKQAILTTLPLPPSLSPSSPANTWISTDLTPLIPAHVARLTGT